MNILSNVKFALCALGIAAVLLGECAVLASEEALSGEAQLSARKGGTLYFPSGDAMADVNQALIAARESKKLLLLVMGANWCHDSRALATRLFEEPLNTVIKAHYETIFVDVGYLDKGKELISHFGTPVYYATPTVLIVDPISGQLVNDGNRHQWGDASNIGMGESVEYFQQMAVSAPGMSQNGEPADGDLDLLLLEIESYEQIQADRLYAAYAVIGPMLKAYKEGQSQEHFEDYWNEVRDFRLKVALDIDALRLEARDRYASGESETKLKYPEYPGFSWETQSQ